MLRAMAAAGPTIGMASSPGGALKDIPGGAAPFAGPGPGLAGSEGRSGNGSSKVANNLRQPSSRESGAWRYWVKSSKAYPALDPKVSINRFMVGSLMIAP